MDGVMRLLMGSVQGRGGATPVDRALGVEFAGETENRPRLVEMLERPQRVAEKPEGAGVQRVEIDRRKGRAERLLVSAGPRVSSASTMRAMILRGAGPSASRPRRGPSLAEWPR